MPKYFKNIWLGISTVLIGMRLTLIHLFKRNVTIQYPKERHPMPETERNRLYVDPELCNGCNQCARACPVECITIDTLKAVPGDAPPLKDGSKRSLWVKNYQIDFAKCCFCGLCTEPCPTNAIYHTKEFEYSSEDRDDLVYTFITMSEEDIAEKKKLLEKHKAEKKKKKEAAAKAKAAKEAKEKGKEKGGDKEQKGAKGKDNKDDKKDKK